MKVLLLGCLLSACSLLAYGQSDTTALTFPDTYLGVWTGQVDIFVRGKGKVQSVAMELHVAPLTDSTYTWVIIYGEDKEAGKRPYELIVRDATRGLYAIDERNGIAMEAYLLDDVFLQRFEVMGNLLDTQTRLQADGTLRWEIFSGALEPVSTSGGRDFNGEAIPPVNTYAVGNYQRAILRRR